MRSRREGRTPRSHRRRRRARASRALMSCGCVTIRASAAYRSRRMIFKAIWPRRREMPDLLQHSSNNWRRPRRVRILLEPRGRGAYEPEMCPGPKCARAKMCPGPGCARAGQAAPSRADNPVIRTGDGDAEFKVMPDDSESVTPITAETSTAILLAEDDPVTRMLMTRFLKKAGYEVDAVGDGTEALDRMTRRYYPILVTDWEMPEMDGIALCKAVRSLQLDGYVYALLLTARDAKEHIIAGLDAGADDYLVKPVHEPELIARLNAGRRILALEHSLRAANERNRVLSITDALTGVFN